MKHFKKFLALICALCLIFGALSGCGSSETENTEVYDINKEMVNLDSGVIAENENFVLNWVKDRAVVTVTSKKDGAVWSSTPVDYLNSTTVENFASNELINSLLSLVCRKGEQTFTYYASTACIQSGRFSSEKIDNGLRVSFYFDEIESIIGLDIYLEEDAFKVKVDPENIKFYGETIITSVTPAPFMASVKNTAAGSKDSYVVLPSGSGALMYTDLRSDNKSRSYEAEMFGTDPTINKYESPQREIPLTMPFYGITNSNSALCAIIESGAESTGLSVKTGDPLIGYSYVNSYYNVIGYEKIFADSRHRSQYNTQVEEGLAPYVVGYYCLSGEEADYTGMARFYQKYLTDKHQMKKSQDNSLLTVKFIGSYVEDDLFLGFPTKKEVSLTSYEEAKNILSELKTISGGSIIANMYGYGEGGINGYKLNGNNKLTGAHGNKKSLESFIDFTNNESIKTFFNFNPVTFAEDSKGYSISKDAAVNVIDISAVVKQFNYSNGSERKKSAGGVSSVMVSRKLLPQSVNEAVEIADKFSITGMSFDTLGNYCYSDYESEVENAYYPLKTSMGADVEKIVGDISAKSKTVMLDGAFSYAAAAADIVTGSPANSAKFLSFDEEVPLYQIVFQGTKAISTSAINMAVNHRKQFLKAIETGSGLSFTVLANYNNDLRKQYMRGLNTAVYSDVKAEIEQYVSESKDFLNKVAGSAIKSHSYIAKDVTRTVFENGVSVVVNYSEQDFVSTDYGTVKALGFVAR